VTDAGKLIAGRYRLVDQIGQGAMGVVWRARDERLDRMVAVKQLGYDAAVEEAVGGGADERAMREARLTARLRHAHAITVHDVVEHDGKPYLIMEYLPSRSMAAVLAERDSLPPEEVAAIGRQLASALAAAHAEGIVHRDVTPGNVLITSSGIVKIADFGISRGTGEGTVTGGGFIAGTPAYLAPEVAGGAEAGFPADVFSLGATLYRALEGSPPFGIDDNPIVLLLRIARDDVVPPRHTGPLAQVLMRLLQRDPERRPTMVEVHNLLDAVSDNRPLPQLESQAPRDATRLLRLRRPRRRLAVASSAGVFLLALGVLIGTTIVPSETSVASPAGPSAATPTAPPLTTSTPATTAEPGCAAQYQVTSSWPGGYQALVTVRNDQPISLLGWTVSWTLPSGHRISGLWDGTLTVRGSAVTVNNADWNAKLNAEGSTTFGLIALAQNGTASGRPTLTCQTL
jgi:serine/threonine protein kinase